MYHTLFNLPVRVRISSSISCALFIVLNIPLLSSFGVCVDQWNISKSPPPQAVALITLAASLTNVWLLITVDFNFEVSSSSSDSWNRFPPGMICLQSCSYTIFFAKVVNGTESGFIPPLRDRSLPFRVTPASSIGSSNLRRSPNFCC